jgi:hypothetical protein
LKDLPLAQLSENFVGCRLDTLFAGQTPQSAYFPTGRRSGGSGECIVQPLAGGVVGEHGFRGEQRTALSAAI